MKNSQEARVNFTSLGQPRMLLVLMTKIGDVEWVGASFQDRFFL